jgi:hypothetical protein
VGGFLLKGGSGNGSGSTFFGYEAAPMLAFNLNQNLAIEAGAGGEAWLGSNGNFGLLLLGDLAWKLQGWGWLDRLFVGFSDYTNGPASTGGNTAVLQYKAGVGFVF